MANEFVLMGEGLCYAAVCTSLTDEQATARMPIAGTSRGWQVSEEDFKDGTPNGAPCRDNPTTHRHILFDC